MLNFWNSLLSSEACGLVPLPPSKVVVVPVPPPPGECNGEDPRIGFDVGEFGLPPSKGLP